MSKTGEPNSQNIIYQTEYGQTIIEVRLQDETVRLSQKLMAELFQKDFTLYKNFLDLGEKIKHKTRYSDNYSTEDLI